MWMYYRTVCDPREPGARNAEGSPMVKVLVSIVVSILVWPAVARAQGPDGGSSVEANPATPSIEEVETEASVPVPAPASIEVGQSAPALCKVWILPTAPVPPDGSEPAQRAGQASPSFLCLPGHTCFFVQCPSTATFSSKVIPPRSSAASRRVQSDITAQESSRVRALARARPRLVLGARLAVQPASQTLNMIQNDDVVVGAEVYAGVRNHVGPKVGMELAAVM